MTHTQLDISLKRAYEPPAKTDGLRILVERLWPRGLTKERAAIDHWVKDLAPSPALRSWYGHQPERWPEFRKRYSEELAGQQAALGALKALCSSRQVTFIFAAKDEARNSALVLRAVLMGLSIGKPPP